MRLPRDLTGDGLVKRLEALGYTVTRQTGSHIRLTCLGQEGEHHPAIPRHRASKLGTLSRIVKDTARHLDLTPDELAERLWGG